MDLLAYEIKRAHWGMVTTALRRFREEAFRRRELAWMTPARFDVLFVTLQRAEALGARPGDVHLISLGELIMKLGMDKTTIARTVRMMEMREFVTRSRDVVDGRQTIVTLTPLGIKAARTVLELLHTEPNFLFERIRCWLDDEQRQRPRRRRAGEPRPRRGARSRGEARPRAVARLPLPRADHHAVARLPLPRADHHAEANRMRKVARLFDRWSYPVYAPDFDPLAVYTIGWPEPPPEFATDAVLVEA